MAHEVTCPNGHRLQVRPEHVGLEVRCPICKATLIVPPLDPGEGPSPPGQPAPMSHANPATPNTGVFSSMQQHTAGMLKVVGYAGLVLGLILVIMARGCDSLAARSEASARAKLAAAQSDFEWEWDDRIAEAKDMQERSKLRDQQTEARETLEKGEWKSLRRSAEDAKYTSARWGWWFELMFLLGTIVLVMGLLITAVVGQGAERYVCLIILTIITFSLYIIGSAWLGYLKSVFN